MSYSKHLSIYFLKSSLDAQNQKTEAVQLKKYAHLGQNNSYDLRGPNFWIKPKYSHVHLYNTLLFPLQLKNFYERYFIFDITFLRSQSYFLEKEFFKIW